jgi:hypothetical protein
LRGHSFSPTVVVNRHVAFTCPPENKDHRLKFRVRIGGSADSGFTAAVGAPTVCGTCPIGEKAHSPDEVCHIDTLIPRAKALALVTSDSIGKSGHPPQLARDPPAGLHRADGRTSRTRRRSNKKKRSAFTSPNLQKTCGHDPPQKKLQEEEPPSLENR